jgi:GH15 family glucan-1,4-alpha-glucosidase
MGPARFAQLPIEDHAIIGDCRIAALISREGSIVWLCLPNFSSPSLFAEILDERSGGVCRIRPRGKFIVSRHYIANTPVLETTFGTPQGAVRVVDLVPILDGIDAFQPMREVLRVIDGLSGELDLEILIDPRPNYGRRASSGMSEASFMKPLRSMAIATPSTATHSNSKARPWMPACC